VRQLLAPSLPEIADGLLDDTILEVHGHATKGKLLLCDMPCLLEGIVVELPVVAVVVEDFHSVFGCLLLKGKSMSH
jgi:hypothetical protein